MRALQQPEERRGEALGRDSKPSTGSCVGEVRAVGTGSGLPRSGAGIMNEDGVVVNNGKKKTAVFIKQFETLYNLRKPRIKTF